MKMCIKILVLMTVTVAVSARKTKEQTRVQYLASPKTDFDNDGLKPKYGFGSDLSRQFGGSGFEDRHKLSVPNFDNYGGFGTDLSHRQLQQRDNEHGFESFGTNFNGRSNFGTGSRDRNYGKAVETRFHQNTHEERPLGLGDLDHGVGSETSDKEVRVRNRKNENYSHKSSSNNFKHDSSFQSANRKFSSSGSSDFRTESSGKIGHRDFNQDYRENQFKSHDVEDINIGSESNKTEFEGSSQRQLKNRKKDQFETIPSADSTIIEYENVAKSNFGQNRERNVNPEVKITEKTTYPHEKIHQEHSNRNNRERDSSRNLGKNDESMAFPHDSRNPVRVDDVSRERSSNNRRVLKEETSRKNGHTPQRKNEETESSSSVDRKVNHNNTEQRAEENTINGNKTKEGEQWIWGEGGEKITSTTKLPDVDDRAAFTGDNCPTGKVKIGNVCVPVD